MPRQHPGRTVEHPMNSSSRANGKHLAGKGRRVGFFVTCLVDLFRPSVGFSAIALLEKAGCTVEVPEAQSCCGQPAYNAGDRENARALARQVIRVFEGYDYIVAPSGSCIGTIRVHYPDLLKDDPDYGPRAVAMAGRCHELTSFLVDVLGVAGLEAEYKGTFTYHDSCSGLRDLKIRKQPRQLLESVAGLERHELGEPNACCGFGGAFSVKYPDISTAIADAKTADIKATGAELLLGGDLGCLLHIAGRLKRQGSSIKVRHVAEVLAGHTQTPAIGEER